MESMPFLKNRLFYAGQNHGKKPAERHFCNTFSVLSVIYKETE